MGNWHAAGLHDGTSQLILNVGLLDGFERKVVLCGKLDDESLGSFVEHGLRVEEQNAVRRLRLLELGEHGLPQTLKSRSVAHVLDQLGGKHARLGRRVDARGRSGRTRIHDGVFRGCDMQSSSALLGNSLLHTRLRLRLHMLLNALICRALSTFGRRLNLSCRLSGIGGRHRNGNPRLLQLLDTLS